MAHTDKALAATCAMQATVDRYWPDMCRCGRAATLLHVVHLVTEADMGALREAHLPAVSEAIRSAVELLQVVATHVQAGTVADLEQRLVDGAAAQLAADLEMFSRG